MKRRRITGFLDDEGRWRDLREPLGEPTGAQLRRLNRLGMLVLVGPARAVPLGKGEAAAAITDARGAAELLERNRPTPGEPGRKERQTMSVGEIISAYDLDRVCAYCGEPCWRPSQDGYTLMVVGRGQSLAVCCDDQWFLIHGDMLSINELHPLLLRDQKNVRRRAQWIAEYERAGLHPDSDPGVPHGIVPRDDPEA